MLNKTIISNLRRELQNRGCNNIRAEAEYIGVNNSTYRCWITFHRNISLKKLDSICDILGIPTYSLLNNNYEPKKKQNLHRKNNSKEILAQNLDYIYKIKKKKTWSERESLFYGMISSDTLISYKRQGANGRYPKISTIEKMSSYLGIAPDILLKKDGVKYGAQS